MKEHNIIKSKNQSTNISQYYYNSKDKYYKKYIYRLKFLLIIGISIIIIVIGVMIVSINNKNDNIIKLEQKIGILTDYKDTLSNFEYDTNELKDEIEKLENQIDKKQLELNSIDKSIIEKQSELNEMSCNIDLIEQYNYALYDTMGNRNDITLNMLKFIITKCTTKNLDPDLVLGIIMVESEGHSEATNLYTGAAGLGQFISDTGEFVATKYLNIQYDHNITPYNPYVNVTMMIEYLSYLHNKYYNDTVSVLMEYSGGDLEYAYEYYSKIINIVGYNVT